MLSRLPGKACRRRKLDTCSGPAPGKQDRQQERRKALPAFVLKEAVTMLPQRAAHARTHLPAEPVRSRPARSPARSRPSSPRSRPQPLPARSPRERQRHPAPTRAPAAGWRVPAPGNTQSPGDNKLCTQCFAAARKVGMHGSATGFMGVMGSEGRRALGPHLRGLFQP